MQLDTFLNALTRRDAQQAVLVSGQPMRVLIGGQWSSGAATPSDGLLDAMLQGAAPNTDTRESSFEARAGVERFQVRVTSRNGARMVVMTRLDGNGAPLASEETALSAFAPQPAAVASSDFDKARNATPLPPQTRVAPPATQNNWDDFSAPLVAPIAAPPPLPVVVTDQWYHAARGERVGPIPLEAIEKLIKNNIVRPETMVWQEGMPDWTMAKLTDLSRIFGTLPPPVPDTGLVGSGLYGSSNSSGTGWDATVPSEIAGGFNIGAFFVTLFWCFAHNVWYLGIGSMICGAILGALFPPLALIVGAIVPLIIGAYGNQIAWKSRSFASIEEFRAVQRAWGWAGFVVFVIFFALGVLGSIGSTPSSY